MGKDYNDRPRRNNQEISKVTQAIVGGEKKLAHKRLKARALCTHTKSPHVPYVTYKKDKDGKLIWICRICGQEMDFNGLDEAKLIESIRGVTSACDFIKIMTNGSERDEKLVNDVLAEIHFLCNAFLLNAYRSAKSTSQKTANESRRLGQRSNSVWES